MLFVHRTDQFTRSACRTDQFYEKRSDDAPSAYSILQQLCAVPTWGISGLFANPPFSGTGFCSDL